MKEEKCLILLNEIQLLCNQKLSFEADLFSELLQNCNCLTRDEADLIKSKPTTTEKLIFTFRFLKEKKKSIVFRSLQRVFYQECDEEIFALIQTKLPGATTKDLILLAPCPPIINQYSHSVKFDGKEPDKMFTGRVAQLAELHSMIKRSANNIIVVADKRAAVIGLGGIGKTQLVAKYVQMHKQEYGNNIIWINAETDWSLIDSFQRLADRLKIPLKTVDGRQKETKDIAAEVYEHFKNQMSLFIFDNVNKPISKEFYPTNVEKTYVILTSRFQKWDEVEVLRLGNFTKEEAIEFIKKMLHLSDNANDKDVSNLASTLHYFPLALKQATTFIWEMNNNSKSMGPVHNIVDYIEQFKKKTEELLSYQFFNDLGAYDEEQSTQTTYTTWSLTVNEIKEHHHEGALAMQLFYIASYFASQNIQPIWFSKFPFIKFGNGIRQFAEQKRIALAIKLLKTFSMVDTAIGSFEIHPLVQEVTRLKLKHENAEEATFKVAFSILTATYFPIGMQLDSLFLSNKQALLQHIETLLNEIARWTQSNETQRRRVDKEYREDLLERMYDGYFDVKETAKSKLILEQLLPIQDEHYGHNHIKFASTQFKLANVYGDLGCLAKQRELLESALVVQMQHFESNHPVIVNTLQHLSSNYYYSGQMDKFVQLQKKVNAMLLIKGQPEPKMPGKQQLTGATAEQEENNEIGHVTNNLNNIELVNREDQLVLSDASTIQKTNENRTHSYYETLLNSREDFKRLLQPIESGLESKGKMCGADHFQNVALLELQGRVYGLEESHEKQIEVLEQALAIHVKHYGPDHFESVGIMQSLADAYGSRGLGDLETQKKKLEKMLVIQEKHYGPDNFHVASTLKSLSHNYFHFQNAEKQKELLERALQIQEKQYGSDHFNVAETLCELGVCYFRLANPTKLIKILEHVNSIRINGKYFGPDHFIIASVLIKLALGYFYLGNPEKTHELLEKAQVMLDKHKDKILLVPLYLHLAQIYGILGNPTKQKYFAEFALQKQENHYGASHYKTVDALICLASAYGKLGIYKKERDTFEKSFTILQQQCVPNHFRLVEVIVNLSNAYEHFDVPEKQKDLLETALEIVKNQYGPEHWQVIPILVSTALVYGKLGNEEKQQQLSTEALSLLLEEKFCCTDLYKMANVLNALAPAFGKLGSCDQQRRMLEKSLAIIERHYGSDHFLLVDSIIQISENYAGIGNTEKQIELLQKALRIQENFYGPNAYVVATTLTRLANVYANEGNFERSSALMEKVKMSGPDHFEVADTLAYLGHAHCNLGDPKKEKTLLERALAIKEKRFGPDHLEVVETLACLGCAHVNLGDPEKGKTLLERALAIEEKHYGPDHFEVAVTLVKLGRAHVELGDPEKGKTLLERALAIQGKHYGIICDGCQDENFSCRRYKCLVCSDYDLCSTCFENSEETKNHKSVHEMMCIGNAE